MGRVDATEYTTKARLLQTRSDFTYTWKHCPECGEPLILNDLAWIGGRGYVRTWQCVECGWGREAEQREYHEMAPLFPLSHREQKLTTWYVMAGWSIKEAIQHAVDDAAAQDEAETIASVRAGMGR